MEITFSSPTNSLPQTSSVSCWQSPVELKKVSVWLVLAPGSQSFSVLPVKISEDAPLTLFSQEKKRNKPKYK